MSEPHVEAALRRAVAQQLRISPEHLTADLDLESAGLTDDHMATRVLAAVEEVLDVRFPDDFFDGVRTYGQLSSAVRIAVGV